MKRLFSAFIFIMILGACSPQARLSGLVKRHPELLRKDTLIICDSVFIPGLRADTFFSIQADTVRLVRDRLNIEYFRVRDTVYLSGQVEADTIVRYDTIITSPIIQQRPDLRALMIKRLPWAVIGLLASILFVAFVIIRFFPKPINISIHDNNEKASDRAQDHAEKHPQKDHAQDHAEKHPQKDHAPPDRKDP